jgi:hypothetical protein
MVPLTILSCPVGSFLRNSNNLLLLLNWPLPTAYGCADLKSIMNAKSVKSIAYASVTVLALP